MKVLIIIPAFNEEANIETLINEIHSLNIDNLDYIVINDCSTDNTEYILKKIDANFISLPLNLGIGGGVQTGYIYAKNNNYDIAIQIDGDGQHDVNFISDIIKNIENYSADVVIGSRFIEKQGFQSSIYRRLGIIFLSKLIHIIAGVRVKDVTSGYRAVNKRMIHILAYDYAQDYPEPEALVTCILHGARICEFPMTMRERIGGESSISGFKSIYYMLKVSMALILQRLILSKGRKL